jgi:DNA-binding response OmpR family regulator
MPAKPARLLCVGRERYLLETRCAVLAQSGYDARSATLFEAEDLLRTEKYDLVIVSALLSDEEKTRILTVVAGSSPILTLNGVTFASELLSEVERKLALSTFNR